MYKLALIGSDSFIATHFYNSLQSKVEVKLISRKASNKKSELVKDIFEISQVDFKNTEIAINFAAIVHQPKLTDDSLYNRVNTELPIHLAKEAKKAGVKHFIQMSTIAVYGIETEISIKTQEQPVNIYGDTKLKADKALLEMQDESFKVSIVRPPMVYGGGKAPGNLQSLINAAQKGIPLPFKGVENARDFIHVGNLVQALNTIIENKIFGIVILTDKDSVSTEQLVNLISKYSDSRVRQIKIPVFIHNMIKAIKPITYSKVFGDLKVECNLPEEIYQPKFTIDEGIEEMINAMK